MGLGWQSNPGPLASPGRGLDGSMAGRGESAPISKSKCLSDVNHLSSFGPIFCTTTSCGQSQISKRSIHACPLTRMNTGFAGDNFYV